MAVPLFASPPPPATHEHTNGIPRSKDNDYTEAQAATRRAYVAAQTGAELSHVGHYSFDPAVMRGNVENFLGVAQVPIGVAGPLLINGEHAHGEFYVPLATTEGAVVASYNRGMRLLTACGGVTATVIDDAMQRAPVFLFRDARQARDFGRWVVENFDSIRVCAEATTSVGKLRNIDQFAVGPLRYLRFNFTTGDAAGQNMAGKATHAACEWIREHHPACPKYYLTGNADTDKKFSHVNALLGRGKRVVAEAVISRDMMQRVLHLESSELAQMREALMAGAFLTGSSSNGAQPANGLAALFIATGQDVANIAESHAAMTYTHILDNGDFYWSITLPSLIVATHGGGTGLPSQKQCLAMLGCVGTGKAKKFAEICAAVVLAGETSLAAAVANGDWVTAHERLGRNRT